MFRTRQLLLLALAFLTKSIFGQISQSSGPVHACAPANITFTAPSGATNITWNFGSFGSSNNASGSFNVLNPSTFNATFSGNVGGSPVTFTVPVTVHAKPTVSFSINQPTNSCVVKTVTLTDQSTASSSIATRVWTYGDGGTGSASGTHTYGYILPGTFSVTLKIIDAYGCENQLTQGPILVTTPPVAVISSSPSSLFSCAQSLTASFSASNSTSGTGVTYNWDFGNGQTSTSQNPAPVTFTSQSSLYNITLTVTANGCTAVANAQAGVTTPSMNVSLQPTVCVGAAPTATIFSNQFTTNWAMGNGNTYNPFTPSPTTPTVALPAYTQGGLYTVTVTAGGGQCTVTPQTMTIQVDQVTAGFTFTTPTTLCNQVAVAFTNTSSASATSFTWTYSNNGSLNTSTLTNPTFTFHADPYSYYNDTLKSTVPFVTLIAKSVNGCSATVSAFIATLTPPVAYFIKDKREGCSPLLVTFTNKSKVAPPATIASYTWCNGASPSVTATGSGPSIPANTFTYTTPGLYRPYLIITTSNGCVDTSYIDTVIVANPPTISFSVSPLTVCPNQTVQITNTSPNISNIHHWHVESDNGFFSHCVNDANPVWKFTHVGVHTFTLSGYLSGCKGTAVSTQSVVVHGPIVKSRYETNCTNRMQVAFEHTLQEVQTFTVNYGDGGSDVLAGNATSVITATTAHTYSASGDYTALVNGVNAGTGCAASIYTMVVKVRNAVATFTAPPEACASITQSFNASTSQDVLIGCSRGYLWYFDNAAPVDQTNPIISRSFSGVGTHTVTLVVKDENSCQSKMTKTLTISDVSPTFSFMTPTICATFPTVQIVNSTPQTPDSVVVYSWGFGNGLTMTTNVLSVPVQTYVSTVNASFNVSLTATNKKGCIRTTTHLLYFVNPNAAFSAVPNNICLPANTSTLVTFQSSASYPSYTFDYGSGSTPTAIVTSSLSTFTYSPGTYTVTMHVKDLIGCENTGTTVVTLVPTPQADFAFSSPGSTGGNSICSPAVVSFTNISAPQPNNASWNLGTGSPVLPLQVVSASYSVATTSAIAISLSVTTGAPYNCGSSVTKNFTVYVAKADMVVDRTVTCLGDQIKFSIDTIHGGGVKSWIWDYGDASSSPTVQANSSPPSFTMHTYNNFTATANGNVAASLLYWSSGNACVYSVQKSLRLIRVVPDYARNADSLRTDTVHCLKIPDVFKSLSYSNSSTALTHAWSYDEGVASSNTVSVYTFTAPGVHQTSLTVTEGELGCKATTVKNITLFPLPTATVTSGQNCPSVPFTFSLASPPGVLSGTWSPPVNIVGAPSFVINDTLTLATGIASATTVFSVLVTDTNACVSDPVTDTVKIVDLAPSIQWDTAVVIGEDVTLQGPLGNFTYTWTPDSSYLSCSVCRSPVSTSTNNITYTVLTEDAHQCAQVPSYYRIEILPKSSVDVPGMFTPNGDGSNDIIYVDGWGIKRLNYFRIYNRWGQLLFETNDIKVGWDGTFRGVPQNVETYVYEVSVDSYIDPEPLVKSSTFKLVR